MNSIEKLTLLMLSEIHEELGIKGSVDPIQIRNAVVSEDFTWRDQCGGSREVRDEDISFVFDVLRMWQDIELSMQALPSEDRSVFYENAFGVKPAIGYCFSLFDGFGGDDEQNYSALFAHIVIELGLFPYFKNRELDAEAAGLIGSYRRMLPVYCEVRAASSKPVLSLDELKVVLGEHGIPRHEKQVGTWEEPRYDITDL